MNDLKLQAYLRQHKEPDFRFRQIASWVYQKGVVDFEEMLNLPKPLREQLKADFLVLSLETVEQSDSSDGQTTKLSFRLQDGKMIESVIMRHLSGRHSLCVSSQTGCVVGCPFCATGNLLGPGRNLTAEEIVDQVVMARHIMRSTLDNEGKLLPSNIVFMGMGEPFLNYNNVMQALQILGQRMQLGGRRLTISTSGVAPRIMDFAQANLQVNLAVSLHAATDDVRTHLVPLNKKFPLKDLKAALSEYMRTTRRKVFFEYVMLKGLNDTQEQAGELIKWLPATLSHVNLIPYNEVPGLPFEASTPRRVKEFQDELEAAGFPVTIRHTMGADIAASCGQLAAAGNRAK